MLEESAKQFLKMGVAFIERNPVEWGYTTEEETRQRMNADPSAKNRRAKTFGGRYLKLKQSAVDYSGNVLGKSFNYDAKQTAKKSVSLDFFKPHQVAGLMKHASTGAIAGFFVFFSEIRRVFFIDVDTVGKHQASAEESRRRHGKLKSGENSFSIEQLIQLGVEVPVFGNFVDWWTVWDKILMLFWKGEQR